MAPMLARLTRELPTDGSLFEPKWDGVRCLARKRGADVDLRSRHGRPLSRYFPELVAALARLPEQDVTLDGETVVWLDGRPDFAILMSRLHPAASRVARLAAEVPATYLAFDVLDFDDRDLKDEPLIARRRVLEQVLREAEPPLVVTPVTSDRAHAERWLDGEVAGVDGVVAKHPLQTYSPGQRTWRKIKRRHTVDCVVAGFRLFAAEPEVGSLLLGLYDGSVLRHVGVVTSFPRVLRHALVDELRPGVVSLNEHPWRKGFALEGGPMGRLRGAAGRWTPDMSLDWVPLRPDRVVEVAYDQVDGIRFRHPARFVRWRPDRDAHSCTVDQLRDPMGLKT